MQRPELLPEEEINSHLISRPLWKHEDNLIYRDFALANFTACMGLANSVAILAEKMDHHPEIRLYAWNKIRFTLMTHDKGGLTSLDFQLAKQIDELGF